MRIVTLLFCLVRVALAGRFFVPFTFASAMFGISELSAVIFTVFGLSRARVDSSFVGILLPLCYLAPLMLHQTTSPTAAMGALVGLSFMQIVCRARMGVRLTIGVPMFSRLLQSFPYSLIRHPLALIESLQVIAFQATFPTCWNIVTGSFACGAIVSSVLIEEKFLFKQPDYCRYSQRVRWRMLPEIW